MKTIESRLAWTALLVFACAVLALGAQLSGYSQWLHPVTLPGARGLPGAMLYNAMVFVLPGLLMALCCWRLRSAWSGAGLATRVGASLLLLSALAFAFQGLLTLDPSDLDGHGSRLHAAAWTAWWIAFVAAAGLLAVAQRRLRVTMLAALALVLANAPLAGLLLPGPLAQRIACVTWFSALAWAASQGLSRAGVSVRG